MNDDRRLRAVHPSSTPVLIDPPCPDTLSDEWITGWEACRVVLREEVVDAYDRGYRDACDPEGKNLGIVAMVACSGFIVGFVTAIAVFVA